MVGDESGEFPSGDGIEWDRILGWIQDAVRRDYAGTFLLPQEQDEAVSIACYRICRRYHHFDPRGAATLETWVRMHAGFAVRDMHRQRRRTRDRPWGWSDEEDGLLSSLPDPDGQEPVDPLVAEEFRKAFEGCLEKLTETQRERFLAAEVDALPRPKLQVVAKALNILLETLKDTLKVARVALRACLDRFDPRPPESPGRDGKDVGGAR